MARAATEGHCRQLGIDGAEMTEQELENLVGKLTLGLHIFVGRNNSVRLATALREEITRRGGGPIPQPRETGAGRTPGTPQQRPPKESAGA